MWVWVLHVKGAYVCLGLLAFHEGLDVRHWEYPCLSDGGSPPLRSGPRETNGRSYGIGWPWGEWLAIVFMVKRWVRIISYRANDKRGSSADACVSPLSLAFCEKRSIKPYTVHLIEPCVRMN